MTVSGVRTRYDGTESTEAVRRRTGTVDVERLATGAYARVGVWLPVATVTGLAVLSFAGVLFFPDAVLFVTFLAAIGWVAVGFGGDRVGGPFEEDSRGGRRDVAELPLGTAAVVYLTATTALGWAIVVAVYL